MIRRMTCRVDDGVPPSRRARDAQQGLLTVTDVDNTQFRCIPLEAILCLRCENRGYRVVR